MINRIYKEVFSSLLLPKDAHSLCGSFFSAGVLFTIFMCVAFWFWITIF